MKRRHFLASGAFAAAYGLAGFGRCAHAAARARVLIVGAGFAGSACALRLRELNPALEVSLIDAHERYVTCPMSNEVIGGLRDIASISVTRGDLRRAGVNVIIGRVASIDAPRRAVRLDGGRQIAFDRLIVAPGIRLLWDKPQGYDAHAALKMPHAWQAGEQTLILARQLRSMDDGGVVAISVPSGLMRCPPAPYERASLMAHYLRSNKPRSKILIFDANNRFPKQDVFAAAWARLYPGMIEWIASTEGGCVVRVEPKTMTLVTAGGAHRVAVANVIPPQAPGRLAPQAGLASDHGWCPIEPLTFESTLVRNVHVIGDACIAGAMPKTASAACSQARQCARAIVEMLAGREPSKAAYVSVCYSMLAPAAALAIPARFHESDGHILRDGPPAPAAGSARPGYGPDQAAEAARWYRDIRTEAFGSHA